MNKQTLPTPEKAIKGRSTPLSVTNQHVVNHNPLLPPFSASLVTIYLGMGCFWGAERLLWQKKGVWTTAVGYSGGITPNPTYEEVCTGETGHAEVVMVVYDPDVCPLDSLLNTFWESHDPTQGMRQGNDIGTQYRSVIYTTSENQMSLVIDSKNAYQAALLDGGVKESISTDIQPVTQFYYAEDYHQQYLAKNPGGYCGIGGAGVCMPSSLYQNSLHQKA